MCVCEFIKSRSSVPYSWVSPGHTLHCFPKPNIFRAVSLVQIGVLDGEDKILIPLGKIPYY